MNELLQYPLESLVLLSGVSILAGVLNAISGGGGMILIPTLITVFGIPPINAIAITKFQNAVGSLAARKHYYSRHVWAAKEMRRLAPLLVLGAVIGVLVLKVLSEKSIVVEILPYVLIAVAIFSILPDKGSHQANRSSNKSSSRWWWVSMALYGGSISLGTGPIMVALHRAVEGSSLKEAIKSTRPIMLVISITSVMALVWLGYMIWPIAIVLCVSNYLGTLIGARLATGKYFTIAKWIVFIVPISMAIKIILTSP